MLRQMDKYEVLRSVSFGQRVAEEEADLLATYFVETGEWTRLYRGDIDIIYGPKGSGKSALYSLLFAKSGELFDRSIVLVPGENRLGTTAFHVTNHPSSAWVIQQLREALPYDSAPRYLIFDRGTQFN